MLPLSFLEEAYISVHPVCEGIVAPTQCASLHAQLMRIKAIEQKSMQEDLTGLMIMSMGDSHDRPGPRRFPGDFDFRPHRFER